MIFILSYSESVGALGYVTKTLMSTSPSSILPSFFEPRHYFHAPLRLSDKLCLRPVIDYCLHVTIVCTYILTASSCRPQVEEQRMLRLNEAKQVEAKAARIKDWVTNKLRDVSTQRRKT